jgi:hypothetical protein
VHGNHIFVSGSIWYGVTLKGAKGFAPTAIGGTGMGTINTRSIFIRSFDIPNYKPDIILIYAGQNDPVANWVSSENKGTSLEDIVASEKPYSEQIVNKKVSIIAAYKGCVEMLMKQCPLAKIYLVTQMRVRADVGLAGSDIFYNHRWNGVIRFPTFEDVLKWEQTERYPRVEYIRAIGKYYGLPVIDLWDNCGFTDFNAKYLYGEPAYDCTQVHPNPEGYKRLAECISTYL